MGVIVAVTRDELNVPFVVLAMIVKAVAPVRVALGCGVSLHPQQLRTGASVKKP
jgi:hypothetical protein